MIYGRGRALFSKLVKTRMDSPNGTFCVRRSSNGKDYTLSLKHEGKTRLIKIIISKDRCGFHEDALHYDSVISLIEYYKRNSLKEYNVHLAIQLLFPLKQQNAQKSFWEIDGLHSIEHLFCQLRGICAAHIRLMRFDEKICVELDSLREELSKKRQARAAYKVARDLFQGQIAILSKNGDLMTTESDLAYLRANLDLQKKRLETIENQLQQTNECVVIFEKDIQENENIHISLLPKYSKIHRELDRCRFRLCQQKIPEAILDKVQQEVSILADAEHPALSKVLVRCHLRWQPDRYLATDCTKYAGELKEKTINSRITLNTLNLWRLFEENAIKIIKKLMEHNPGNSDGIFLIRPSQSQDGQYALTLSYGDHIHNCLVEYRDIKHPESCGFAFLNTKLFFPTIVDFVRYYSNYSMKEHNTQLDTRLKMPAFRGTL
ncbi:unnamed protein product [Dracunculus medinensis]|uniref:SH2 domain-containing protein n=1 Tax=Dracunculus medinensis TaxID=318479 RepID=A0A0N4U9S2_DRAME|nr:unnamed protein product [Dracunculus medinensis]